MAAIGSFLRGRGGRRKQLPTGWRLWAVTLTLTLIACGGGSVGTGTGEGLSTFEGIVVSREGAPLAGVVVAIAESGVEAITDASGMFSLAVPSESVEPQVEFQVTTAIDTDAFIVDTLTTDPSGIVLEVVIDEAVHPVAVRAVDVTVRIVGTCAASFLNDRIILQQLPVSNGTVCEVQVDVTENGVPRSNVGFSIEYRSCSDDGEWFPLVTFPVTAPAAEGGVVAAAFPFEESSERCVYRVRAPLEEADLPPVIFEIKTLLKQSIEAGLSDAPSAPLPGPSPSPGLPVAVDTNPNTGSAGDASNALSAAGS